MTTTLTMLGNMKAVKMLGLSKALYTTVSNLREAELKTSEVFRKLLICTVTLCEAKHSTLNNTILTIRGL